MKLQPAWNLLNIRYKDIGSQDSVKDEPHADVRIAVLLQMARAAIQIKLGHNALHQTVIQGFCVAMLFSVEFKACDQKSSTDLPGDLFGANLRLQPTFNLASV